MKPAEYFKHLEGKIREKVEHATEKTAKQAVSIIRDKLPAKRRRTRRATTYTLTRSTKTITVTLGLRFSAKYPSRNTETESLFREAWREVEPAFQFNLQQNLNDTIGE